MADHKIEPLEDVAPRGASLGRIPQPSGRATTPYVARDGFGARLLRAHALS